MRPGKNEVCVFAPATVGNMGPFFDSLGYCLDHLGDFVVAKRTYDHKSFRLTHVTGPYAHELNSAAVPIEKNCVQIVADTIFNRFDIDSKDEVDYGIDLELHKCMPTQTGLGSSAASSVAAAKAIYEILGSENYSEESKLQAALEGDMAVTGAYFPDNIIPSFVGGVNLFANFSQQHTDFPSMRRGRITKPEFFTVAFLFNGDKLDTKSQRELTTQWLIDLFEEEGRNGSKEAQVGRLLKLLAFQAGGASLLVDALSRRDLSLVGEIINSTDNNFLLASRKQTIPRFDSLKTVMASHGALGVAISGSGPAVFGIADNKKTAEKIKDGVSSHFKADDVKWLISGLNVVGAKCVESVDIFMESNRKFHNFW